MSNSSKKKTLQAKQRLVRKLQIRIQNKMISFLNLSNDARRFHLLNILTSSRFLNHKILPPTVHLFYERISWKFNTRSTKAWLVSAA